MENAPEDNQANSPTQDEINKAFNNLAHQISILSDDQIKKSISVLQASMATNEYRNLAIQQWTPLINLGINELQSRKQDKVTKLSFRIAVIALAISIIQMAFALTYSNGTPSCSESRPCADATQQLDAIENHLQSSLSEKGISGQIRDELRALSNSLEHIDNELKNITKIIEKQIERTNHGVQGA